MTLLDRFDRPYEAHRSGESDGKLLAYAENCVHCARERTRRIGKFDHSGNCDSTR